MLQKLKPVDFFIELLLYAAIFVPMVFFGGVEPWIKALAHFFVAAAVILYLVKSLILKRLLFFSGRSNALVLFFVTSVFLSTVFSVYREDSLRTLIVFMDAVAIFLVTIAQDRERKQFERILYVLIVAGVFHALYAIYKPLFGGVALSKWHISGTFYNHNHFAAFIELLFFIPVLLIYFKKDVSWKRYVLWFSLAVFSVALVLALSRGAIISVILTLAVFSSLVFGRKKAVLAASMLFFCLSVRGLQ